MIKRRDNHDFYYSYEAKNNCFIFDYFWVLGGSFAIIFGGVMSNLGTVIHRFYLTAKSNPFASLFKSVYVHFYCIFSFPLMIFSKGISLILTIFILLFAILLKMVSFKNISESSLICFIVFPRLISSLRSIKS